MTTYRYVDAALLTPAELADLLNDREEYRDTDADCKVYAASAYCPGCSARIPWYPGQPDDTYCDTCHYLGDD